MKTYADLATRRRDEEREKRIVDFVFAGLIQGIAAVGGRALPEDEDARALVRLARTIYDEIDQPTEPPKPSEHETPAPPREPGDVVDELYGEQGPLDL